MEPYHTCDFEEHQLREIREYIGPAQLEIQSCINCQPSGLEAGDDFWFGGYGTYMRDLLGPDQDVPEEYHVEVASYMRCPRCGSDLDIDSDIGVIESYQKKVNALWKRWRGDYLKRFRDFHSYLERHPYLGLNHEIGQELFNGIREFRSTEITNRIGYRARRQGRDVQIRSFADMYPPPPDVGNGEGRYNHFGQRVFYLANSMEGAANEVLERADTVWMQKFRIVKAASILTLTSFDPTSNGYGLLNFGLLLGEFLSQEVERRPGWRPEYFIPRFIADCAKHAGFRGIKYQSSRYLNENLVLFEWDETEIEPVGEPFEFELDDPHVHLTHSPLIEEFYFLKPNDLVSHTLQQFDRDHNLR